MSAHQGPVTTTAVRRRVDPMPPSLLGVILFVASECIFFAALFGAYFTIRAQTSPWPPQGSRHKLSECFQAELCEDWEANGKDALRRACEEDPAAYIRVVASANRARREPPERIHQRPVAAVEAIRNAPIGAYAPP